MEAQESFITIRFSDLISGICDPKDIVVITETNSWVFMVQSDRLQYWLLSKKDQVLFIIKHMNEQPFKIELHFLIDSAFRHQEYFFKQSGITLEVEFCCEKWNMKIKEALLNDRHIDYPEQTAYLEKMETWIEAVKNFRFPFNITDYRLLATYL